jgi:hypothetical protein
VYSSQLTEWCRARDAGTLGVNPTRARTGKRDNERLKKKNQQLQADVERTRMALDIVGKAHALLESLSRSANSE